ncbi:ubiquitin-related domain-containing protein [Hyaloraphidium curvatum]|nr:ubiquitin-related domain-containing protein [Hyaloraphidium curvatum]
MQIFVRTLTNKTITLLVGAEETVDELKAKIHEKEGLKASNYVPVGLGCAADCDRPLTYYAIRNDSTLHLVLRLRGRGVQIFVKTLTGKSIGFNVDLAKDTVTDLKRMIDKREGIPVEQQRLIYGGKQVQDNVMLADYGVLKESTLHLVLRLKGGL